MSRPEYASDGPTRVETPAEQFRRAWEGDAPPLLEEFLKSVSGGDGIAILGELLPLELEARRRRGEEAGLDEYLRRFPQQREVIERVFQSQETFTRRANEAEITRVGPETAGGAGGFPEIPGYDLLAELGRGGMGVVYKARDRKLRHLVAIKMPLAERIRSEQDRDRFLREARSAAGLRHPNICPIHLVDEREGRPFIVMAYIEGQNLRQWMEGRTLTSRECAELVARLARAVEYAHQHQIVHRDIKPANTLIDAENRQPILMDFGLAKEIGEQDGQLSQTGDVIGTPAYMAPEQAAGRLDQVGPLSDVYSLGAVLYYLLCRRPPFQGAIGEVIARVQNEEPTPPRKLTPTIHRDLETICQKAMAREPAARYPSAAALAEDLERFSAGDAILARREGFLARAWRKVRRNRVAVATLAALLVASAAGGVAYFNARQGNSLQAARTRVSLLLSDESWTPDSIDHMGEILAPVLALSSEDAEELRRKLLNEWGRRLLRKPGNLDSQDHATAEAIIKLVAEFDPEAAVSFRQTHATRMSGWDEVFKVASPFEKLEKSFDRPGDYLGPVQDVLKARRTSILTSHPSQGPLRLEAVFAEGWEESREIGLLLNATASGDQADGYAFVLRTSVPRETFASARRAGQSCRLLLMRNRVPLREETLYSSDLLPSPEKPGRLRMVAQRLGDRLTFQVNEARPLEFRDLFPPPGRGAYGVLWPPEAGLVELAGWRQQSQKPSDLEKGDDLYQSGKLADALGFYRKQARDSAGSTVAQEARVKAGICLTALDLLEEAGAEFETLSAEKGDRWPAVAALQLWAVRLRQKRFDEADILLARLREQKPGTAFAELARLLPEEALVRVLDAYRSNWGGASHFRPDPLRVVKLQRLIHLEETLSRNLAYRVWSRLALIRAMRVEGQTSAALNQLLEFLHDEPRDSQPDTQLYLAELGWLYRDLRQADEGLRRLDEYLYVSPSMIRPTLYPLLVERARLLTALGRKAEAEQGLQQFLGQSSEGKDGYRERSDAWLMLGFLRDERGDSEGARQAFRQARFPGVIKDLHPFGGSIGLLNHTVAGSLGQELPDSELLLMMNLIFRSYASESIANLIKTEEQFPLEVARECWRTPRGKAVARRFVFQELPFATYIQEPATLIGLEAARRMVFEGRMTPEQEDWAWAALGDGLRAILNGQLGQKQLLPLASTWKGFTNWLGWASVKASLKPEHRGPIAYLMGHRYLRRNNPKDARMFFEQARADAPAASVLHKLAKAELDRLPR